MIPARDITFESILESNEVETAVVAAIHKILSPEQYGELAAMFFLSRDRFFSECFDELIEVNKKRILAHDDHLIEIGYLFEKTNLLSEVTRGAEMIGRLKLAEALKAV